MGWHVQLLQGPGPRRSLADDRLGGASGPGLLPTGTFSYRNLHHCCELRHRNGQVLILRLAAPSEFSPVSVFFS